ncbi:MAG: mandelate racemase/muconate lactonizing enzyme family protein [Candidatus Thermoplasmatota archaeon]|jgi:L-alanine-DL-glutamate epimerase-like enolase superfamily enzyme|nr:mandelate racemase/muconate lactonizing enzyme family protein [Candidatus Thermoplasmatota archaeon]
MTRIKDVEILELGEEGEKSSPWSSTILVLKVVTGDGEVGYGEAPTTLMTRPVYEEMNEVKRVFLGREVEEIERNYLEFYKHSFYLPVSMESTAALSAFEIASWDIVGKEHGAPIYDLLGGKVRDKVRAYANGWYDNCITPQNFLAKAKEVEGMGFTAAKFDPFGSNYDKIDERGVGEARKIIETLKERTRLDLLIECHGRFSANSAIRVAQGIEDLEPFFVEEPVHPDQFIGLKRLRERTEVRIALGERVLNKNLFLPYFVSDLVDVIQPDITNVGGIIQGRESAVLADSFGVEVAYHNAFGPIQTAATLHLDYNIPNFLIQESFEKFWPKWKKDLVKSGYSLDKGYFSLSGKPGLGIEVNEKILSEYKTDKMESFNKGEPPWVVKGTFKKE